MKITDIISEEIKLGNTISGGISSNPDSIIKDKQTGKRSTMVRRITPPQKKIYGNIEGTDLKSTLDRRKEAKEAKK